MSSGGDIGDFGTEDDGHDPSLGPDVSERRSSGYCLPFIACFSILWCVLPQAYVRQYLEEHENQVALWNQMTSFRREYMEMRSEVESVLTGLSMELSTVAREASCQFVLLLSQMGCSSCSTGVSGLLR